MICKYLNSLTLYLSSLHTLLQTHPDPCHPDYLALAPLLPRLCASLKSNMRQMGAHTCVLLNHWNRALNAMQDVKNLLLGQFMSRRRVVQYRRMVVEVGVIAQIIDVVIGCREFGEQTQGHYSSL